MVVTHSPSNVLLILVPLMPNLALAVAVLLIRFSISQMDVPTRQSYTMAVVRPEERSAVGGITGVARTAGAAISPIFAGFLFSRPALIDIPFFIAGILKIGYNLALYRGLRRSGHLKSPINARLRLGVQEFGAETMAFTGSKTRRGRKVLEITISVVVFCVFGASSSSCVQGQRLRQIAKFDLPGPEGKRFDYVTVHDEDHFLLSAHLGPGILYVIDLQSNKVVKAVPGVARHHWPRIRTGST
jgi:MFS family permease